MADDSHQHQPWSYYDASEGRDLMATEKKAHQLFFTGKVEVTMAPNLCGFHFLHQASQGLDEIISSPPSRNKVL